MGYANEQGRLGERVARAVLEKRGYAFVAANVITRGGEIDLVMCKQGMTCFVEVKTRAEGNGAAANEVSAAKWRRLRRAVSAYISTHAIEEWCFLLVTVRIMSGKKTARVAVIEI